MIKRKILPELISHLEKPEIIIIIGPRQCGKTTLLKSLIEHIKIKGKKYVYYNLDFEDHENIFLSQQKLLAHIRLEIGSKGYVFIDEIQRKKDAGRFLKGIYDMGLNYKFIITGSGSLELKEKIHESIMGRKKLFHLNTISLEEFINHRTNYTYENKLAEFFKLTSSQTTAFLKEYLVFGGYPQVILAETAEEKAEKMTEIIQSFIEKDIVNLIHLEKRAEFSHLLRILASQNGQLLNISELANTLNLSQATVIKYLWYLEKVFITDLIHPFHKNFRKEITKAKICYFCDLGLKNYLTSKFQTANTEVTDGFTFQNLIHQLIKKQLAPSLESLHFWRSNSGAEVDFVINTGTNLIPLEVKLNETPKITRSLLSFISKYQPKKGYLISLNPEITTQTIQKTTIHFIPWNYLITKKISTI